MGSVALILQAAACYSGSSTPPVTPVIANAAPTAAAPGAIVISTKAIGLVDASTPATLDGLRQKLVGFEVKASNDEFFHFDVFKDGEKMFYVVESDGKVFNVHAVSPKITVEGHPSWKVGTPFSDASLLTECDCWGEAIVCWKAGESVAAAFDRKCDNMTGKDNARALRVLDGVNLQRMVWRPTPFGEEAADHNDDQKQPKGGGLGGTVRGIPTRPDPGGDPCGDDSDDPCGD